MGKVLSFGTSRVGKWLSAFLCVPAPASLKLSTYAQPVIELANHVRDSRFEVLEYIVDAALVGDEICAEVAGKTYLADNEVFEVHAYAISGSLTINRVLCRFDPTGVIPIDSFTAVSVRGFTFNRPYPMTKGWVWHVNVTAGTPNVSGFYLVGQRFDKA